MPPVRALLPDLRPSKNYFNNGALAVFRIFGGCKSRNKALAVGNYSYNSTITWF